MRPDKAMRAPWSLGLAATAACSWAGDAPAAAEEAVRMVSEKVTANMALGCDLMSGKLGSSPESIVSASIEHYSKSVGANRKRLGGKLATSMPENGGERE
jgi:hypothetical protein